MMKQLNDHPKAILGHSLELSLFRVRKFIMVLLLFVTVLADGGERVHLGGIRCSFYEDDNLLMHLHHWYVSSWSALAFVLFLILPFGLAW